MLSHAQTPALPLLCHLSPHLPLLPLLCRLSPHLPLLVLFGPACDHAPFLFLPFRLVTRTPRRQNVSARWRYG